MKLFFEKTTLTIHDKAEFYEIAYKLYSESRKAFSDIDHMIYCVKHQKELANQRGDYKNNRLYIPKAICNPNESDIQKQNSPKLTKYITHNSLNKIDNKFL